MTAAYRGPVPPDAPLPSGAPLRIAVDWARCEPAEGRIDEKALEDHAAALDEAGARGLVAVVELHRLRHPSWLGDDFWSRLEAPVRFGGWASAVGALLGGHCRRWVTVAEPNVAAVRSWLSGTSPPGRLLAVGDLVRSLDHLLAAHVVAHGALHRSRPDAAVTTTVAPSPVYELGELLTDVLTARSAGVQRPELHGWLGERRRAWYAARPRPARTETVVRRIVNRAVPLDQALPRTVDAVWTGPHDRLLDDLGVELPPAGDGATDGIARDGSRPAPVLAAFGRAVEATVLGGPGRPGRGVATAGRAAWPS